MEPDVQIVDETPANDHGEQHFQLYIDGGRKARLIHKHNYTELVWQVYGPQYWPAAKALLQGLLDLSVLADQLTDVEQKET